jgi:signal transduction histidine kinase
MSLPGGEVAFVGVEADLGTAVQPGSDVPAQTLDAEGQARTQANLALSLAEVRELHLRLAETEQAERSHISRHLHDVLGGDLTSLSLSLAEVLPSLEDGTRARRVLAQCLETVEQLGSKVRDVMAELQPPMLEEVGIAATLRRLGHRFAQRSGIVTRVRASEPVPRLSRIKETVLVRIVGEALSNLRNHAEAANAWVTLYFNANMVRLTVTDDGIGFAGKTLSNSGEWNGWGIVGMRERATAVGGTLRIESALGRGTRVIAEIPR